MLTETGVVVAVEADALWVETIRRSTCGGCSAQTGCGHGLLNKLSAGKRAYIRVLPGESDTGNYRVGQQVLLNIPEEVILRGSIIVYLLPLLCMLAGAALAVSMQPGAGDLLAVSGAVAGLAFGFGLVRWHGILHARDGAFQPVLLRAVGPLAEPVTLL